MTPNMQNDGHDTTVDYAGNWSRTILSPLLNNTSFSNRTLLLLTFDENETYTIKNQVWALLLGDVIPDALRGTTDPTVYTHYSCLSTIQNNWGLYHLGRGDVIPQYSNVFQLVANITGYQNQNVTVDSLPYLNFTASGYFDPTTPGPIPAVNETAVGAGGKGILPILMGANGSAIAAPSSASATAGASASASGSASASSTGAAQSAATKLSISYAGTSLAMLSAFVFGFVVLI
jgi:hypothetical protein